MHDARWSQLKQTLIEAGWVWRDDALYAPHETMWFTTNREDPDMVLFRNRMTIARDATASNVDLDVDQAALHADLVSLVAALDAVLAN